MPHSLPGIGAIREPHYGDGKLRRPCDLPAAPLRRDVIFAPRRSAAGLAVVVAIGSCAAGVGVCVGADVRLDGVGAPRRRAAEHEKLLDAVSLQEVYGVMQHGDVVERAKDERALVPPAGGDDAASAACCDVVAVVAVRLEGDGVEGVREGVRQEDGLELLLGFVVGGVIRR